MDLSSLRRQEHLTWLHAYVHAFDASKAQVTPWTMEHDRAAVVHHVCLEQHFVDMAVVVHNVGL
jgi:hypothetical protein